MSVWATGILVTVTLYLYDRYRVRKYYSPVLAVEV